MAQLPPQSNDDDDIAIDWPEIEAAATAVGMSRAEIRATIKRNFPQGATSAQAKSLLRKTFDFEGYGQYASTLTKEDRVSKISLAEWQRLPEHRRHRLMNQRHISEFDSDDFGNVDFESQGYTRRKSENYAFPISSVTRASHLGIDKQGRTISTFSESKVGKRMQLLGAHEQVQLRGPGVSAPFQAPMRSGPESRRPETLQTVRGALVVGGDPGPAGQMFIDPQQITGSSTRYTKVIKGKEGRNLGQTVKPGQVFQPGQPVQLAEGLTPYGGKGRYQHKVLDVVPRKDGGYRFVMERSAPTETALIRSKMGATKSVATARNLAGVRGEKGHAMNLGFLAGVKDVGGAAFSHLMTRSPASLAKTLGVSQEYLQGKSYAELGERPMQAFQQKVLPRMLRTINVPTIVSGHNLERLRPGMAVNPRSGKVDAFAMGDNRYRVNMQYQALVGNFALQASEDHPVKHPFLSRDELTQLQQRDPQTYAAVRAGGRRTQSAYREIVNTALATTGEYELPRRTVNAEDPTVRARLGQMMAAAQSRARSMAPEGQDPSRAVLQNAFLEEYKQRRTPIAFNTEAGQVVLPSGRSLARYSATGGFANEDVSKIGGRAFDLTSAFLGGDQEGMSKAARRYTREQMEVAGGREGIRKAMGMYVGNEMMRGSVIRGSEALHPNEVYIPGMENQAVHTMRFPTQGGSEYSMQVQSISRKQAMAMGLHPDAMYASIDLQQAMAGDFDGDLAYALSTGLIQTNKDGKLITKNGKPLATISDVRRAASVAKEQGAGDIFSEMAATQQPLTKQGAKEQIAQAISGASRYSEEQLGQQLAGQRGLYENIGGYYNAFIKGRETAPGPTKNAMQKLFNISHGIAQRPEVLPEQLRNIQDLMNLNPAKGTFKLSVPQKKPDGSMKFYEKVEGGLHGVRRLADESLINLRNKEGGFALSNKEVASLIGGPGSGEAAEAHVEALRGAGSMSERAKAQLGLQRMMSTQDWATQTGLGRMIAGNIGYQAQTRRGMSQADLEGIAGFEGIGAQLFGLGEQQNKAVLARRKESIEDPEARKQSLISRAEAAREVQGAQFVQRKAGAGAPQQPVVSRKSASAIPGWEEIAAALGDKPAAQQPVTATRPTAAIADDRGGAGYGMGVPFKGDGAKFRSKGYFAEFEGGGGAAGGGGGGGGADTGAPAAPGGKQPPGGGFAFPPPKITGEMLGRMSFLRENLGLGMANIDQTGMPLGGPADAHSKKVLEVAQKTFPELEMDIRKAKSVLTRPGATPAQKELAEQYLQLASPYMNQSGQIGGEYPMLAQAFERSMEQSASFRHFEHRKGGLDRMTRLSKTGRTMVRQRSGARDLGEMIGQAQAMGQDAPIFQDARAMTEMAGEYQQKFGQFAQLKSQFSRSNYFQQQGLGRQMEPLSVDLKSLKDSISALKPVVDEHIKGLKEQTTVIKEDIKERSGRMRTLESRLGEIQKQMRGGEVERKSDEDKLLRSEAKRIGREMRAERRGLTTAETELGAVQYQERALTSMMRDARTPGSVAMPRSGGAISRMMGGLQQSLDPQRMFYQSQLLGQGYYMFGMPLMRARESYLGQQESLGRMNFALGQRGGSPELEKVQQQRAMLANIGIDIGQGVQSAIAPGLEWMQGKAEGGSGDFYQKFGRNATYTIGGLLGLGAARMIPGVGPLTGMAVRGAGRAAGGAIGAMLPGGAAGAAGAAGGRAGLGSLLTGAAGAAGMGITAGMLAYDYGLREEGQDTSGQILRKRFAIPAMLGYKAADWVAGKTGLIDEETRGRMGEQASKFFGKFGDEGFLSAGRFALGYTSPGDSGPGGGKPSGAVDVNIVSMKDQVAERLMMDSRNRLSRTQSQELIASFAEATGLKASGLGQGSEGYRILSDITNRALDAQLNPEQLASYIAKAPQAAGLMPGSKQALDIMGYASQFDTVADLENRLTSLQAVSPTLERFGMPISMAPQFAEQYKQTALAQGQFRADRELSQTFGMNVYDFSDRARANGMPEMAIVDEQGRPMHQQEQWDIEDRQRRHDFETSQKRGKIEIDWAKQRMDLEQEFWDFRREAQEKDFEFSQRHMDLNIRNMEHSLEMEQKRFQLNREQYMKQYNLQKQMFDLQTKWQRQDFDKQQIRMETRRSWQVEDFAMNRETFNLQTGWQEEDMQRSLRYASGRERLDIRRQMERNMVMNNLKSTQMDREESRAGVEYGWQQEDLATARSRFEEMRALQEEMMQMQLEYWQKNQELQQQDMEFRRQMAKEQIQLMKEEKAHAEWKFETSRKLEERQREFDLMVQEQRLQWQQEDLEEAARRFEEQNKIIEWQRQMMKNQQDFNMAMTIGFEDAAKKSQAIAQYWKATMEYAMKAAGASSRVSSGAGSRGTGRRASDRSPYDKPSGSISRGGGGITPGLGRGSDDPVTMGAPRRSLVAESSMAPDSGPIEFTLGPGGFSSSMAPEVPYEPIKIDKSTYVEKPWNPYGDMTMGLWSPGDAATGGAKGGSFKPPLHHSMSYSSPTGSASAGSSGTDLSSVLLALSRALSGSGSKIIIDKDSLRDNGFIHVEDFNESYGSKYPY